MIEISSFIKDIAAIRSYKELCEAIFRYVQAPVVICDKHMNIISEYPLNSEASMLLGILKQDSDLSPLDAASKISSISSHAVFIPIEQTDGTGTVIRAVMQNALDYSSVIIFHQDQETPVLDALLDIVNLKIRSDIYPMIDSQGRIVTEIIKRLNPQFGTEPFNPTVLPPSWNRQGYYYLLCLKAKDKNAAVLSNKAIIELYPGTNRDVIFDYQGNVLIITKVDNIIVDEAVYFADLTVFCRRLNLCCGISRPFETFQVLTSKYHQAYFAAEQGFLQNHEGILFSYESFWVDDLLLSRNSSPPLAEYVPPYLFKLQQYDTDNHTNLMETLECYLRNNQSISLTAKEMYFHRNTLNARIAKIKEIIGIKEIRGDLVMPILLALRIMSNIRLQKQAEGRQQIVDTPPK